MTDREKVIKELENYEPYANGLSNVTIKSSVILNALALLKEQEMVTVVKDIDVPNNDCISRQDAIDAICLNVVRMEQDNKLVLTMVEAKQWAADVLQDLPSVKTERKKGKWMHGICNVCGYNWGKDAPIASVPPFCPNCGADMRGEKE